MKTPHAKTWFITGISRGFGLALAEAALARGDTIIGTTRDGSKPEIAAGRGELRVLALEISDSAAVAATVDQAFDLAGGRIEIIVNNAGYGLLGAIEEATDAEAHRLFEIDIFGKFRIIRAALPHLRAQGGGHIVNITSIAGRAPGPGTGLYAAAKFALEGLSASLSQELAPIGVKVTAVAPGAFRTDFLSDHSIRKSKPAASAYEQSVGRMNQVFDDMAGKQLGDPARFAAAMLDLADAPTPPAHLLLGSDALARTRRKLDADIEEINQWEKVTRGTDFPAKV